MRESIPKWDFQDNTNSEHYRQDAGVWGEHEAPWVLANSLGKDGGLLSVLINIYVFMYILLVEGGMYVIFILTYAGERDMPPLL